MTCRTLWNRVNSSPPSHPMLIPSARHHLLPSSPHPPSRHENQGGDPQCLRQPPSFISSAFAIFSNSRARPSSYSPTLASLPYLDVARPSLPLIAPPKSFDHYPTVQPTYIPQLGGTLATTAIVVVVVIVSGGGGGLPRHSRGGREELTGTGRAQVRAGT